MSSYKILNTTEQDLEFVYFLFDEAIKYQEKHKYPIWKGYDKNVLRREANESKQFKIVIDDEIAMIFSVIYNDKLLWRERDNDDGLYLHRIVVNPKYKGRKLFGVLLDWTINHAVEKKIKYLRMDTWGNNPNIIAYYESYGFKFIGNYTTPDIPELPIPHRNLFVALLEMKL
jgi:GNAT superfamily N-acetyltransferase